jgi:hypothetical protein
VETFGPYSEQAALSAGDMRYVFAAVDAAGGRVTVAVMTQAVAANTAVSEGLRRSGSGRAYPRPRAGAVPVGAYGYNARRP